jgi:tetratricopeptide (TPR) repeat protein
MRLFLLLAVLWSAPSSLLPAPQDTNPRQPSVPESTSAELIRQGKFSEARVLLDGLLKDNPGSADLLYQLGRVDLAERKFKDAEDTFQRAYELNPANLRSLMGIVETNMAQNKTDEALKILQTESDKAPSRLDLLLAIGNTALRAGKLDFAIQTFNKLIEQVDKGAKQGDIYLRLGETYRRKGDSTAAIQALQKAREILPDNTVVLNTLASVFTGAGRKPEAEQVYEAALKLDPNNAVVLNNLAFLLAETGGDLDDALTKAQRAKQLLPNLHVVSDTLGWIYLKKNLTDNALEIFIDLVRREPSNSTYHYHLGLAYSQKGDKTKALDQLREALKYNPSKEEKELIQRTIDRLGLIGYRPPTRRRGMITSCPAMATRAVSPLYPSIGQRPWPDLLPTLGTGIAA